MQPHTPPPPSRYPANRRVLVAILGRQLAQNVEMWASRWECVIQTFFALDRFGDVKNTWKRSNNEVLLYALAGRVKYSPCVAFGEIGEKTFILSGVVSGVQTQKGGLIYRQAEGVDGLLDHAAVLFNGRWLSRRPGPGCFCVFQGTFFAEKIVGGYGVLFLARVV